MDDQQEWKQLNDRLRELYQQGDIPAAIPIAQQALELARTIFPSPNNDLATSLNNLALLHKSRGQWADAETFYDEALKIREELFGEQPHEDLAISLNNLAEVYRLQERYLEAEPLYERVLAIFKELAQGQPTNDLALILNNLAGFYRAQKRWDKAIPLCEQALAIRQDLFGDRPNSDLAFSLSNVAELYGSKKRWKEAIPLCERAIAICEKLFGDRPNNLLASSLNNLAKLYGSQKRWAEANSMSERALAICQELFGEIGHPDFVTILINFSLSLALQQQPAKALPLLQQAIAIENKWLPNIIFASNRQQRLKDLQRLQIHLDALLSLTQQYFSNDAAAVTAALNAVLSRKAKAATTEATLNQAIRQQPELAPDLLQLKTYQQQIATLSYAVANKPELKDDLSKLLHQRRELEKKLSRSIPAFAIEEQVIDRQALTSLLPADAFLVEFVRYRPLDFLQEEWQITELQQPPARYLAFIVQPDIAVSVAAIDCGLAEPLDLAIDKFRRAYADINLRVKHSGFGDMFRNPPPEMEAEPEDENSLRQFLDRLLPNLPPTGTCYLATDSHLQILPFHLLETTDGEYLGDRYSIHHLTTARDLLRHQFQTSTNPPVIVADPDYDGGTIPTASTHTKTGLQVSDRLDGQPFDRLPINRMLGERVAATYEVPCYTDTSATVERLEQIESPRLLLIATHGFSIPSLTNLIETLQNCNEVQEESILRNRASEITPEFRTFWQKHADEGNESCRRILAKLDTIASTSPPADLLAQPASDPMLRSGIALAGANIWRFQGTPSPEFGKGVAFADDIAQWNLWGNELSLIITCVSALGDISSSEGVFGLRRALAIAGAKYVISSLWNIPTKPSVLLMDKFFEFYQSAERPTPTVALAAAQNYIRNVTLGELRTSSIGREIIEELQHDRIRALNPTAPDDTKPLATPYFWGAWICQG
jgi:tetratricopeptide (TPR) repeat protein/CHAT domain-containing protein